MKCIECGSEMLRASIDCGTIKGAGFRRVYGIAWICPRISHTTTKSAVPQVLIYCTQPRPKVEVTSEPEDIVSVDL